MEIIQMKMINPRDPVHKLIILIVGYVFYTLIHQKRHLFDTLIYNYIYFFKYALIFQKNTHHQQLGKNHVR